MRARHFFWVGATIAGCGAAAPPPIVVGPADPPPPNENTLPDPVVQAPAPSVPSERVVLIDGVRDGMILDELGGFRLVEGAGTVALVGPDGHVRASHRFAFGSNGASAVFLSPEQAIVGNGDQDGFRGPWAGELDRWTIDTDTLEELRVLGYSAPQMARLDGVVAVVSPSEGNLMSVTATSLETYDDQSMERLGWAPGRPPECYVGTSEESWLVRAGADGRLVLTPANGPVPETPPFAPATGLAMSRIGARGLPAAELAPSRRALALSTASTMLLLGVDGIGAESAGMSNLRWLSDELIEVGEYLHPVALPTIHRRSLLVDRVPYPDDPEGAPVPEMTAYAEWRYQAEEAEGQGIPVAPLVLPPVCSHAPPTRCVRAHLTGIDIDRWELFDPARPARVIARIEPRSAPPGQGYVVVAPGGTFVREFGDGAVLTPLPRGDAFENVQTWVELESGWVFVDPQDSSVLRFVPFRGRPSERVFVEPIDGLTIVDATHVLVRATVDDRAQGHVVTLPTLGTERTIDLGSTEPHAPLRCGDGDLVREDGTVALAGGCPVPGLEGEGSYLVTASDDRAFWLDARLGDEVVLHRASDGAALHVRVTTAGVLVSGPGGVFEGTGEVLDHIAVREPGPVRAAAITTGAEARARFERPGLTAAFFRGDTLPVP